VRETPLGGSLYQWLGGDTPGRTAAYVATGAMGLAFLLSVVGFCMFLPDQGHVHEWEERIVQLNLQEKPESQTPEEKEKAEARHKEIETLEHDVRNSEDRWSGRTEWAHVGRLREDSRTGIKLELGYRIDSLAAIMFLMVTLVAALIHVFSIG